MVKSYRNKGSVGTGLMGIDMMKQLNLNGNQLVTKKENNITKKNILLM